MAIRVYSTWSVPGYWLSQATSSAIISNWSPLLVGIIFCMRWGSHNHILGLFQISTEKWLFVCIRLVNSKPLARSGYLLSHHLKLVPCTRWNHIFAVDGVVLTIFWEYFKYLVKNAYLCVFDSVSSRPLARSGYLLSHHLKLVHCTRWNHILHEMG